MKRLVLGFLFTLVTLSAIGVAVSYWVLAASLPDLDGDIATERVQATECSHG